jgi:putative ABC transport system substrate-binding protein
VKRREFISLVGGAAAAWPLAVRAQQPGHPLIGVLSPLSAALAARNIAGFRSGLRDLGYLEGRDVTLALRYGDGAPERMATLAQELVALKPDVLMMGGAKSGALAAQAARHTIPIVIITTDDPVALGVADSIARPGGNITGTWFDYDALVSKRLEFLKLAVPALGRVGIIVYPDDAIDALTIPRLSAATRALGITLEQFEIRDLTKLEAVAAAIERANVGALFVGDGPTLNYGREAITAMVARLRLPAMYGFREFADVGGLMSYGFNLPDAYRQSVRLVVRILWSRSDMTSSCSRAAIRKPRPT